MSDVGNLVDQIKLVEQQIKKVQDRKFSRTDEKGNPCPGTLGEYLDMVEAIAGKKCEAAKFLLRKISDTPTGRDTLVIASDHQMRMILLPLMRS